MKQTSQLNKKSSQRFPWQVVKNLLLLLFSPVQVFETGGSSALCCLSEFAQNTPTDSVMLSNLLILHPSLLFCLQSLPASGFFFFLPMSWFFTPGGQSIGASPSATILSMNIPGWFPLELTGLISLQSKELSRVFSRSAIWKHQFFSPQPSVWFNFHIHTWLHSFDYMDLCWQDVISAFKYTVWVCHSFLSKIFLSHFV